jgi:ribosomal protein S18 acetylase RimI-like enzyme
MNMGVWRQMWIEDIPHVYNIAMNIWTIHKERQIIYENKFCSFPEGCYVYDDNGVKGYIISHPYNISSPPKINTFLTEVETNCLFIHDIVIVSEYRGRGIGNEIITKILDHNPIVSLVASDDNTKEFWMRYGFEVVEPSDCDYGIYMVKNMDHVGSYRVGKPRFPLRPLPYRARPRAEPS